MENMDERLLSMVVTGRNDDYMGNFKYRLTSCLNMLGKNVARLGAQDQVEAVVTDWGSDVPLSQVLRLTPEAAAITRFLYVPQPLTRQARPNGDFFPACAVNTGIRRARGTWRMIFDADSLIPLSSLGALLELLRGEGRLPFDRERSFFFFPRCHVPWEIVQRFPNQEGWERYLFHAASALPKDPTLSGAGGSGAGQMAHRRLWEESTGYDESLEGGGWVDCEFALRLTERYPWVDVSFLGITFFHMEHWSRNRRGLWLNSTVNRHAQAAEFGPNGERWGLGDVDLEEQRLALVETDAAPPELPWPDLGAVTAGLTSRPVRKHVAAWAQHPVRDRAEWEALCALSWYAQERFPRVFLEYGFHESCAAAVVAAACPGVELYLLDAWPPPDRPTDYELLRLKEVGYRGYTRVVGGDPATAWTRLRASSVWRLGLDLVRVKFEMLGGEAESTLLDLIDHLEPGGMLVLTSSSTSGLASTWHRIRSALPRLRLLESASGRAGLVLAGPFTGPAPGGDRLDFGWPRPRSLSRAVLKAARGIYGRVTGR